MGHYAAEMMCDRCGNLRCTCPPKKVRNTDNGWVVGDGYEVLHAIDYQNQAGHGQLAFMKRMYKKHYRKRADAEAAAREACEIAVEATRLQLNHLKNVLKVKRPWEAK